MISGNTMKNKGDCPNTVHSAPIISIPSWSEAQATPLEPSTPRSHTARKTGSTLPAEERNIVRAYPILLRTSPPYPYSGKTHITPCVHNGLDNFGRHPNPLPVSGPPPVFLCATVPKKQAFSNCNTGQTPPDANLTDRKSVV